MAVHGHASLGLRREGDEGGPSARRVRAKPPVGLELAGHQVAQGWGTGVRLGPGTLRLSVWRLHIHGGDCKE